MKLPEDFRIDMQELLGHEFDAYMDSYDMPRWYGLRVNTQKISVSDFLAISPFELSPIPWIENGFYYDGTMEKPGKHPYYFAGLYYLQEPSAMTPANHLPIIPGEKVLDLCAAPGGKTTELGAKLQGKGLLVSNDISNSRARILLKNQELMGLSNIYVMSENPEKMLDVFPEYFDKILVDAPCSGEGMFRKDPKMVKSWEEQGPEVYAEIQRTLITQAAAMLKPGGMILYSTCTFNQEENEGTIAHLLEKCPEFKVIKQKDYSGFRSGITKHYEGLGLENSLRLWPQHLNGEGHYLCLVEKNASSNENVVISSRIDFKNKGKKVTIPEDLQLFFQNIAWDLDASNLHIVSDKVYLLPSKKGSMSFPVEDAFHENNEDIIIPDTIKKLRLLRNGLLMGEMKKDRFEPSQALAMSIKKDDYKQVIDFEVEDIRVMKYLKGETIDVEDSTSRKDKGWYLVRVDGFSLGWAKLANQTLKNKYQVGWRIQS